jgi:hypothetical protein
LSYNCSGVRQRVEDDDVQMQVANNLHSDHITPLHVAGNRTFPSSSATTELQTNQEEPMVCSTFELQMAVGVPQGVFKGKGDMTHTKQILDVNEQGDNNKVFSQQAVQSLSKSTISAVSEQDKRPVSYVKSTVPATSEVDKRPVSYVKNTIPATSEMDKRPVSYVKSTIPAASEVDKRPVSYVKSTIPAASEVDKRPVSYVKSTVPVVSDLDKRPVSYGMSPVMPKAFIPSLEELRAKVAMPSKVPSPKLLAMPSKVPSPKLQVEIRYMQ